MPGRERQRYIRTWINQQTRKGQTALDYVCDRLADGDTLVEMAEEIEKATQIPIPQHALRRWLQDQFRDEDVVGRFTAARKEGASADVERAQYLLDNVPEIKDAIMKAKARADFLIWKAGVNNRAVYGPPAAANVNVSVNLAQLHLDALRTRKTATQVIESPSVAALPAEVLHHEDAHEADEHREPDDEGPGLA